MIRLLPILAVVLLLAGCGERPPLFAQTRLIIRCSGTISAATVDRFADEFLSPLFPAGITRIEGRQQWRSQDKTSTSAPCIIFEMVHLDNPDNAKRVEGALLLAKRQFGEGVVTLLQGNPDVRF